jgi:hypothetical protein
MLDLQASESNPRAAHGVVHGWSQACARQKSHANATGVASDPILPRPDEQQRGLRKAAPSGAGRVVPCGFSTLGGSHERQRHSTSGSRGPQRLLHRPDLLAGVRAVRGQVCRRLLLDCPSDAGRNPSLFSRLTLAARPKQCGRPIRCPNFMSLQIV